MTWTMKRLEGLLDAYGADTDRWPEERREGFAEFLRAEPLARQRFAEERALDRLLVQEPSDLDASLPRLADRIVSAMAAEATGASAHRRAADASASLAEARKARAASTAKPRESWRIAGAAALLAASLTIGFYLGASGFAPQVNDRSAELANGERDVLSSVAVSALPADLLDPIDEDSL
jgi:hypothetical protein